MLCAFASKSTPLLSIRQSPYLHHLQEKVVPLHLAKPDKSIAEKRAEREKELLEIGGDPFFLTDDDLLEDDPIEDGESSTVPSLSLLGMSGVSSVITGIATEDGSSVEQDDGQAEDDFLWDGEVDESAYFDYN